jgi:hypothetical protein
MRVTWKEADTDSRGFRLIHELHGFWHRPENQAQANWAWLVEAAEADPNKRLRGQHFSKYDYYRAVRKMRKRNPPLGLPSL